MFFGRRTLPLHNIQHTLEANTRPLAFVFSSARRSTVATIPYIPILLICSLPHKLPPTSLRPKPPTSLTSTCARSSLWLDKTNTQERYNRSSVASMHAKTLPTCFDNSRAHILFASFFCGTLPTCIIKRWTVTFIEPCFWRSRRRPLPSLATRIRRLGTFFCRSHMSTLATTSTPTIINIPYKQGYAR